jgi:uncharacterized iron-regulated membrane protein
VSHFGTVVNRVIRQAALVGGLLCLAGVAAEGQRGGSTTLTVSGDPAAMAITTALAGFAPDEATNAVTTYTVKTNAAKKITGQLNAPMPPGMTLTVNLVAVTGATSQGTVILDATPRDLVVNITNAQPRTAGITYVLSATPAAGVVPPQSRTVTFTITNYP